VVSSALESSVGLAAGVALAAALPDLPYACGLATSQLLVHDVVAEPLLPVDGALPVRRPAPDADAFADAEADPGTRDRWLARYGRLAALLEEAA
jgi:O-succinylbenzoate synthase